MRLTYCSLILICLLSGYFAHAETPPNNDSLFETLPSVYEASKYAQKITKAPPGSLGVVTADEIKKYGYRTFSDIIASLKGFYSTNDRAYGYVGARGFGIPSDYNTRLLLLIDGHRFNDNVYDYFDITEGFPVDVDMIERVEVIRGPSSSMYGTSAFFGIINVITKRGRDQNSINVKASYGSNNAYKTSISLGKRLNNGLESFLAGTFYDNQGYNSIYTEAFDDFSHNNGRYIGHDGEQAKKLLAKLNYKDFTLQGLYVRRNKEIPTAAYNSLFNSALSQTIDESFFLDLSYTHNFANQLSLQSRLSYNSYRYTGIFPYATADTLQPLVNYDLGRGQWWRAEANLSKLLWDSHKVTLGVELQDNFDQFQTNFDVQTNLYAPDNSYKWAVLLQDEYYINEHWTFNTGVRLDYFSDFGSTINPRAGLIYNPWQDTQLKLLYGSAFRAPNKYEQNYGGFYSQQLTNPYLTPEKLKTLELIVEQQLSAQIRSEINLFYTQINDLIELSDVYAPNLGEHFQQQNRGRVHSLGAEAQLEGNWRNGWQGRLSYSWQNTRNQITQQTLVNSPEHLIKLNIIAPLWVNKVFLGFETQFMSARKTLEGPQVNDHILTNVTLFSQNWFKGLELSAGAYNLFNIRYYDPASHNHAQDIIVQDGATFRIKVSMDF